MPNAYSRKNLAWQETETKCERRQKKEEEADVEHEEPEWGEKFEE
jgi:hypothetical protein